MEKEINEDIIIHHSKKTGKYYTTMKPNCNYCLKECTNVAILKIFCNRKEITKKIYCLRCMDKENHVFSLWSDKKAIVITEEQNLPSDAIQLFSMTPALSESKNISSFDINEIKSEITINKTRHAKTPSIKGASIGDSSCIDDGKDVGMSGIDALEYLDSIKNRKPITSDKRKIEYEDVKKVEKK